MCHQNWKVGCLPLFISTKLDIFSRIVLIVKIVTSSSFSVVVSKRARLKRRCPLVLEESYVVVAETVATLLE